MRSLISAAAHGSMAANLLYEAELKCRNTPVSRGQNSAAINKTTFLKIGGKTS